MVPNNNIKEHLIPLEKIFIKETQDCVWISDMKKTPGKKVNLS